MTKLIPAILLAIVFGCSSKPTWTEYKTAPVTMQFPCSPGTSAAVTKCTRSDGSEYAISVVDKGGISDEEELKQSKEYAENIPYGTLIKMDAFPLRWRESRRTTIIDSTLYYKGGKEYVVSVSYTTEKPPALVEEFLSKVKVE